ncbi:MAG: sulfatase family protein [Mariniblastus sp.]
MSQAIFEKHYACLALLAFFMTSQCTAYSQDVPSRSNQPNIVLVMADDQGWGQTGYNGHPILKTPHLDEMAANGLRFKRFYAAAPVCSPTRASVLTGRTNRRTGVDSHGYALRLQEKTLATALSNAGYHTGHFGKWHLNGLRGPGVPISAKDSHHPGVFGFDTWLSVTNFFDRNPILSRNGNFEEFEGDSSEIIVDEALKFISEQASLKRPSFTVIWFGTPHSPFMAAPEDALPFAHLDRNSQDQHGELVAMDRSIGTLRKSIRELGIAEQTIIWFTSDNGGLPRITPETVGGLRGFKGSLYEGGLRVPAVIEWPSHISPRVTSYPSVSMDIFPTLAEVVKLPASSMLNKNDGVSLKKLFDTEITTREKPIPFDCLGNQAVIDNNWKLIRLGNNTKQKPKFELYNLPQDPHETLNLFEKNEAEAKRMLGLLADFDVSIRRSIDGKDYPEGEVLDGNPEPRFWNTVDVYKPFIQQWQNRPEYSGWLKNRQKAKRNKKNHP